MSAWHLVFSTLNPAPCISSCEICVRKGTHVTKVGACRVHTWLHRSWGFAGEAATPPRDTDVVYPSHLLGINLRPSAGQMTAAWIRPSLATSWRCSGPRQPEWEAGAGPQTSGRRPGSRQIGQDVSEKPGGTCWPSCRQGQRLVRSVVPRGTCVALCGRFLTLCSPPQAQRSGRGGPRVTPISADLSHQPS